MPKPMADPAAGPSSSDTPDSRLAVVVEEIRRAQDLAVVKTLDARGRRRRLAPVSWTLPAERGVAGGPCEIVGHLVPVSDPARAAGRWAAELGLTEVAPVTGGCVEYRGRLGELTVVVWAVVDRDVFEAGH